jgi:transcriptional regulator with XRE-family HTH domain
MANRSAVESRIAGRFRLLIDQLAREAGHPQRGWQAAVARRLGLSRSFITRYLAGEIAVGTAAIDRACETLGLSKAFFTKTNVYPKPSYTRFLIVKQRRFVLRTEGPVLAWQQLLRVGDKLADRMKAKDDATVAEVYDFARQLVQSSVFAKASRIALLNPRHRGNTDAILRLGGELAIALTEPAVSEGRLRRAQRVSA